MAGSSQDLTYRIVSTAEGDGFSKTVEEAHAAAEELEELLRKAEEADAKDVEVKVKADTGEAEAKLEQVKKSENDVGSSAGGASGGIGGLGSGLGTLAARAVAAADVLTVLPAAFAGLAAAGGVLTLGLGGVASALHAYGQESGAAGVSSAQMAQQAFSNAQALRNAQDQITQARTAATQQQENSAQQLISAEESLRNAEQSEMQAQQALTQARQDASRSLIQANEAAATATLNVRAAQDALNRAQAQQIQTDESLTATAQDKEDAALAVAQAQNNLVDVTERAKEAQQDATTANAKGVEGSDKVVAAKQAEARATQSVGDAQRALANTQRQAAEAQTAAAQQVAKAIQNLADTQKQQALAAAASAQSAGGGVKAFSQAMQKLTPIGREFVDRLIGMKGAFEQLRATAQNTLLPGFFPLLDGLQASLPGINGEIGAMGHILGGLATQFGLLLQSPVFRGELGQIFKDGNGLLAQFGSGALAAIKGIVDAVAQAGPAVQGLGSAFHDILATGIPALFQGLVANTQGTGQAFAALGGIIADLGAPLGQLVGALSGALGPILTAIRPVISELAGVLVQALVPVIHSLTPLLVLVAQLIGALMPIIGPVVTIIGQLASMLIQTLVPALQPLIPVIQQVASMIGQALMNAVTALMPDLVDLIQSFAQLLPQVAPILPQLAQLAVLVIQLAEPITRLALLFVTLINNSLRPFIAMILNIANFVMPTLTGALHGITEPLNGLANKAQSVVDGLKKTFGDLTSWISGLGGRFASAGSHMWDWIRDTFRSAINTVIGWWNGIHFNLPKVSTPLGDIGGGSIGVPSIPYLARGGFATEGGLAVVGDDGPELIQMPTAARVISNPDARAMLGGGQGLPDLFKAEITMRSPDGREIDKQLVTFQRQGGVSQAIRAGALAAIGTGGR